MDGSQLVPQGAQAGEGAPGILFSGATVMRPTTSTAACRERSSRKEARPEGGTPTRPPAKSTSTRHRGRAKRSAATSTSRRAELPGSRAWMTSAASRIVRTLLRWRRPTKCHRASGAAARFATSSCA